MHEPLNAVAMLWRRHFCLTQLTETQAKKMPAEPANGTQLWGWGAGKCVPSNGKLPVPEKVPKNLKKIE